jgi:tetratricopeptide (TPR) repeat protein
VGNGLIVGRNLDFEAGDIFDREKAVITFRPDRGISFVSVSWPGMTGVITGVNAERIYVSMNAARTDEPYQQGIPAVFLLRQIMEQAKSIKDALAVIKRQKVMGPLAVLIADGKANEAVVVELSTRKSSVRRPENQWIGLANHFLHKDFKGDAKNERLRRYLTSGRRFERLAQLLKRSGGQLSPKTAAQILRSRSGTDDKPFALGNRSAIDALIATHSVVVDLKQMVLWVSRGPHLIDRYVVVDLRPLLGLPLESGPTLEDIPADPLAASVEFKAYQLARQQLVFAKKLKAAGRARDAIRFAERATQLMPDSDEVTLFLADLLWEQKDQGRAKKLYQRYLGQNPPYLEDVERAKERLR